MNHSSVSPKPADLGNHSEMASKSSLLSPTTLTTLARGSGLAAIYFLSGKFGLSLAFFNISASPIWPPTGIALAAVLLWGYSCGWGVFVGAFLVNLTTQGSVETSLAIALGNTLEAFLGAWLVRRFIGTKAIFQEPRRIVKFVSLAAVLSTLLSPIVGVTSLCLGRFTPWNEYGASWVTWWLGDVVSDLTIAPFLLIWATRPFTQLTQKQLLETAAIAGTVIGLDAVIFPQSMGWRVQHLPIGYLALLPMLWAAFRFGQRGAITASMVTSTLVLFGTVRGAGPFIRSGPNESLMLAQAFVATMTLTALLVAAVVSQQREIREALRTKEGELRLITDNTPLMLTRCTRDLRYAFVNRAYANMTGRIPEDIVGKKILEIMGTQGFETIRPYVEKVLAGHQVEYEEDIQFSGVGERYLRVCYSPDPDEHGEIRGWIASITDITERKQAELTRARLSSIVESSDDAIVSKDLDGKIVTWNEAAERILGYRPDEIVGSYISRIVPPELQDEEEQILERLRRGESLRHFETVRLAKNGEAVPVSLTISPLKDSHGKLVGACSIGRDITQRKQTEQALANAKADLEAHAIGLEKTVAERTAQLRETNSELEAFSFSLSHDLRAPLRAIRNFTQAVLEDCQAQLGPHAATLERVVAASKRMDRLIRDVLALSRISRKNLESQPVDAENLLLTITSERPELQAPQADVQISSPLPYILGDEASLSQCVTNLLENAVKFVPEGKRPRIVVRGQNIGDRVRLWFEDNGIGIDRGAQEKIFDMFHRAHSGSKYEGSGLGLAIVRKAVERMGGTVGVESEPGRGSRFWLELPRA